MIDLSEIVMMVVLLSLVVLQRLQYLRLRNNVRIVESRLHLQELKQDNLSNCIEAEHSVSRKHLEYLSFNVENLNKQSQTQDLRIADLSELHLKLNEHLLESFKKLSGKIQEIRLDLDRTDKPDLEKLKTKI